MLEGLVLTVQCPPCPVLREWPFTLEMHRTRVAAMERYKASRLSLTPLGEAILGEAEDFSRHNPIHRWWGGTELTSDQLWRWDPASRSLIAP